MADDPTPFADLVDGFGWRSCATFTQVYATVARRLGQREEVTDRQVRRWRAPEPPCPQPGRQRVLEAMLGVPLEQLGFRVPEHRRNAVTAPLADLAEPQGGTPPVERRTLFTLSAAVLGSAALPAPADAYAPQVGTDTVADLRHGLASLYGLDDRFGGATVGPLAAAHLSRVERLISTGTYPDIIGRQLRLISGETAEHVGWLAFDAGDHQRARRYWTQARNTAVDLRDDSLTVLVLASLSLLEIREQDPKAALDHAQRASALAQPWAPPSLMSILATRQARALALLGDPSAARTTLAHAARLYDQDQGARPAPAWTLFHGPAELGMAQAELFTAVGHHRAAVRWLRLALERQEATYARNEALARAGLAGALARSGEADEAAFHIEQGEALLTEVSSGRAREGLAQARRELARTTGS
ncbi:hypothetical protein GCM10010260_81970 [Streptomyces filipinensis]|uniref:Transcriptional regulator n=1 Tax=Streptomyces filipinensis TaxID=66887 RepID=A0A918MGI7_9ACTN|nr:MULTISPECIES: hypothetical protein [Streptomyces]MDH6545541.1 tetratricopeptide (TPR) repeat protein [Streptomyces sp. SPB4]GGV29085.1 hypothetical protein GCM10010260_81970 [Streptomyces filipinensis]